jgi:hypothetical protein
VYQKKKGKQYHESLGRVDSDILDLRFATRPWKDLLIDQDQHDEDIYLANIKKW